MSGDVNENAAEQRPSEGKIAPSYRLSEEPSPIPGMDLQAFRNYLMRALSGDETVPATIRTRVDIALR